MTYPKSPKHNYSLAHLPGRGITPTIREGFPPSTSGDEDGHQESDQKETTNSSDRSEHHPLVHTMPTGVEGPR